MLLSKIFILNALRIFTIICRIPKQINITLQMGFLKCIVKCGNVEKKTAMLFQQYACRYFRGT
jgi:hypothetical protein